MKARLLLICSVLLVVLMYFGPPFFREYSYTIKGALRSSFPVQAGVIVFEKEFGHNRVVLWDTGNQRYAKLVTRILGIFYRVNIVTSLHSNEPEDKMKIAWSCRLTDDKRYDTILASEVLDPNITKIIVSNEGVLIKTFRHWMRLKNILRCISRWTYQMVMQRLTPVCLLLKPGILCSGD